MHVLRTKIDSVLFVFSSFKDETPLVFSILGVHGFKPVHGAFYYNPRGGDWEPYYMGKPNASSFNMLTSSARAAPSPPLGLRTRALFQPPPVKCIGHSVVRA